MEYVLENKILICLFHRSANKFGDQEPQNARQCYKANGVCLPLYCPNNSKKIGRCTHRHFCCKW
uniref:Beta-defensin-like domain-containing protein n=1 Tax=Podarcis muralis TaxID=64176 RepID=A0A670K0C1_PODMU